MVYGPPFGQAPPPGSAGGGARPPGPPPGNEYGYLIRKLTEMNQAIMGQSNALMSQNQALLGEHTDLKNKLTKLEQEFALEKGTVQARYIEDIPGKRVPYLYGVNVEFATAATAPARTTGTITVSQDGPFVAVDIWCTWRVTLTGDANIGRFFPVSSGDPHSGVVLVVAGAANDTFRDDMVDFLIDFTDAGADRQLQNIPIPGHLFQDRPLRLNVPWFLERNSAVTVGVTQLRGIDSTGIFSVEMHGYKIIAPIDYRP